MIEEFDKTKNHLNSFFEKHPDLKEPALWCSTAALTASTIYCANKAWKLHQANKVEK